jgi:hypothetical protein
MGYAQKEWNNEKPENEMYDRKIEEPKNGRMKWQMSE